MLNPFDFLSDPASGNGNGAAVAEATPEAKAEVPKADQPKVAAATAAKPRSTRAASRQPLYLDLETIPDESRQHLFDLPPVPQPAVYAAENEGPAPTELIKETVDEVKAVIAKAQSGGKKLPRVILEAAIAVEQKRPKPRKGVLDLFGDMIAAVDGEAAAIQAAIEANRKTMSITPEMCSIVSAGWAVGSDHAESMVVGMPTADGKSIVTEKMILEKCWSLIANFSPVIGFNILGFDLPTLFVRSMLLDVDPTKKLDMRPWGTDVIDLMAARFPKGGFKGMKPLATLMGLPVPAEGIDGSQVYEMFKTNPAKVADYVRSDIAVTRALHKKYAGFFC